MNRRPRFDKYHPIPARYVQKRLRSGYRYPAFDSKNRTVSHLQPEVKKIAINTFIIKTPYKTMFDNNIQFILIKYGDCWALLSDINEKTIVSLLRKRYHSKFNLVKPRYKRYILHLMNKLQLNKSSNFTFKQGILSAQKVLHSSVYYIVISDHSIQNAYYRLLEFQLAYCGVVGFLLYH